MAERSEDRTLVGMRFPLPVQTCPEVHLIYCTISAGSFPGVKWTGHVADHPPPFSAEVKNGLELHLLLLPLCAYIGLS